MRLGVGGRRRLAAGALRSKLPPGSLNRRKDAFATMLLRSPLAPLTGFLAGIGVLRASTALESYLLLLFGMALLIGAVTVWAHRTEEKAPARGSAHPPLPAAA